MAKKKTKVSKAKTKKTSGKKAAPKAPKKMKKTAKKVPAKKKPAKRKPSKTKAKKAKTKVKAKQTAKKRIMPASVKKKRMSKPVVVEPLMAPAVYVPAPNETAVGKVTHYYSHLQVAVVHLDRGALQVGDTIHVKGHTTDFHQEVESMEIEHQRIDRSEQGDIFGLKVINHAREHDVLYKVQT
jgi:putative protease